LEDPHTTIENHTVPVCDSLWYLVGATWAFVFATLVMAAVAIWG